MTETWTGSDAEAAEQDEARKVSRVAAFIYSVHGERAVEYARRLESESEVPDIAERIRLEVERLAHQDVPAMDPQAAPTGLSERNR